MRLAPRRLRLPNRLPCPLSPRLRLRNLRRPLPSRLLHEAGLAHQYLEFGSYLSQWRRRNALKMWTGWPTFPMVFAKGVLIGGYDDLKRLVDSGELKRFLVE